MSAKYMHTTADKKPDLHKQLGCMNGLFKIFRRQHFITGRHINSHSRKILPPGERGNPEPQSSTMQEVTEKNRKDGMKEKERTSAESSSSSVSSSSYSSIFSSTDRNSLAQSGPSILGHRTLTKAPSHAIPKKKPDPSFQPRQPSTDNRNICKIYELTVKTKAKPEGKTRVMKHVDSPRPQQVHKSSVPRISDHGISSRVIGRERNHRLPPKDAPRFSYDERESKDKWKSAANLRELPRFSLDSRESLTRRAAYEPRSNSLLEKLMGLEAFPDPMDGNISRTCENLDPISTPLSRKALENKHNQISSSPRATPRAASSPELEKTNFSAKPNTRFPLESVSWRQTQNSDAESKLKPQSLNSSVYAQIEKRLTVLDFKKSGKDLRALKQILEAMQIAKVNIEDKKNESICKQSHIGNNYLSRLTTPIIKANDSPKKIKVSIAIESAGLRKPRTREDADTKKELIPRKKQFRESSQQSCCLMEKRNSEGTYRSKGTSVSPSMQQNRRVVEKKSHPITHTSKASTPKRAVNRHHTETFSPCSKLKQRSCVWQKGNEDKLSEISIETRLLSHQRDGFTVESESNVSTTCQTDDVTNIYRSEVAARLDEFRSKSETKPVALEQPSPVSILDTKFYAEESPSPVKYISAAFTDENNLSYDELESDPVDPVNFLNNTTPDLVQEFDQKFLENIKHLNDKIRKVDSHDEADANNTASLYESTDPMYRYVAEILSASGLFKDLGPSSTFSQLHPSCRFIDPYLFYILEQTKSEQSKGKIKQPKFIEKIHRKLLFDTTDEILVNILVSAGFSDPCISTNKLGLRSLTGKKLLERICLEMNHLETNLESSLPSEDHASHLEIPGLVLDIERLIFKDLICEIVSSEAGLPSRLNKHRRQLFNN